MIKKLVKHGNSLALIFDKPILDLLNIDKDTPLEITTNGDGLFVRPIRDSTRQARFDEAMQWANKRYGNALRNLAKGPKD